MKDFDLDAAKRGAAVCTFSGNPVRIICFDKKGTCTPIIGLIECGIVEKLNRYDDDGGDYYRIGNNNLMMRDDDYLEKLARGEYVRIARGNLIVQDSTVNEFEKFEGLRQYIVAMASTGQAPVDWSGFIAALNAAIRSSAANGATIKESLQVDPEYWRYEFAGRAMLGMYARGEWREDVVSAGAVTAADALLAELKK